MYNLYMYEMKVNWLSRENMLYKPSSTASSTGSSSCVLTKKQVLGHSHWATSNQQQSAWCHLHQGKIWGLQNDWKTKLHRKTWKNSEKKPLPQRSLVLMFCSRESNCHWALGIEGRHVEQVQENFNDNQNLPLKKKSAKLRSRVWKKIKSWHTKYLQIQKLGDLLTKWCCKSDCKQTVDLFIPIPATELRWQSTPWVHFSMSESDQDSPRHSLTQVIHYITNPNNAPFRENPSKLSHICNCLIPPKWVIWWSLSTLLIKISLNSISPCSLVEISRHYTLLIF